MDVLHHTAAHELSIAGRITIVIGVTPGKPVVGAEPEVPGAVLVDDAEDVAELLSALELILDDAGAREDVVVRNGDASGRQSDLVRITRLVDRGILAAVVPVALTIEVAGLG